MLSIDNVTNLNSPLAVLCDFDGTATPIDVCMLIYDTFAGGRCKELNRLWDEGKISTAEEAQGCYEAIQASLEEMEQALLNEVPLDPAFLDLMELCEARGYPLAIVSDGFDWYIRSILRHHGIDHLPVYANRVYPGAHGYQFSFPWSDPQTTRFGVSKTGIIQQYRSRGYPVVFIGDGLSDLEAAEQADLTCAKSALLDHCRLKSIPAVAYSSLSEIVSLLRGCSSPQRANGEVSGEVSDVQ